MEEDMDEGQTQKGKNAAFWMLFVKSSLSQFDMDNSSVCQYSQRWDKSTNVSLSIVTTRAAVQSNTVYHWVLGLHWRGHIYVIGIEKGVCTVSARAKLSLFDKAFMLVAVAERDRWKLKNQTKLLDPIIHQFSGLVLYVQPHVCCRKSMHHSEGSWCRCMRFPSFI